MAERPASIRAVVLAQIPSVLVVLGALLAFWNSVSVRLSKLEQRQGVSEANETRYVDREVLDVRLENVRLENRILEQRIVSLEERRAREREEQR